MSGSIENKPRSFQEFVHGPTAAEPKESVAEIARKYLGVADAGAASQLDPSRFSLPAVKDQSFFDWIYDFVMHFIKGHDSSDIERHEDTIITILTKSPLEATANDYAELNALEDYVPSHYQERFSVWKDTFNHYALIQEKLSLSETHVAQELHAPLDLRGSPSNQIITLQRRVGYCLLGQKYASLKEGASLKYNEALQELARLFDTHAGDEDQPFISHVFLLESLLDAPKIDDKIKDKVRDYVNLEDARRYIRENPDDSLLIAQSLAAISPESPLYPAATEEMWNFYLDHEKEFKDTPFMDVGHMESRLEGLSVPPQLQQKLFGYFLKTDRPEEALRYKDAASPKDLTRMGQWFKAHDELGRALDMFEKAASKGDLEAKFEFSKAYIQSSNPTRIALAAKYLEEIRLSPEQKKFASALTLEDTEKVGKELFKEGKYKEAAIWLNAPARTKPELRWMSAYGEFLSQKDLPLSERRELSDSLIEEFKANKGADAAKVKIVLGLNELLAFEKSEAAALAAPIEEEDVAEAPLPTPRSDVSHFINAIHFFEEGDKALLKDFALQINLGLNKLLERIADEERAAEPADVAAAEKAVLLLQAIPGITLDKDGMQKMSLLLAQSYTKLKGSHGKLTEEEQRESIRKSAEWLLKAGPLAPLNFIEEQKNLLMAQGAYPALVSELAALKASLQTKPAEPVAQALTQAAQFLGLVKDDIPQDDLFVAASKFLESVEEDATTVPPLERLKPLENTAVLNKLSSIQLTTLLSQILQKLHPEIPAETTAVETLTKGLTDAATAAKHLLSRFTSEASAPPPASPDAAGGAGATSPESTDVAGGAGAPLLDDEDGGKIEEETETIPTVAPTTTPQRGLFSRLKAGAKNIAGKAKSAASSAAQSAKDLATGTAKGAKNLATGAAKGASSALRGTESAFKDPTSIARGAKELLGKAAKGTESALKGAGSRASEAAKTAARGLTKAKAPLPFSPEDHERIGALSANIEKALIAQKNYQGTLAIASYLLANGYKEEAQKKLNKVVAHAENPTEKEAALRLLSIIK